MSITVLGVTHRTAPLEVRERFAHAPREVPIALERVLAAGARGGVLLSTCNRTEFYVAEAEPPVPEIVWTLLSERLGDGRDAGAYGYIERDRDAVRHLYRVSAGLDMMNLGETQMQGLVRGARDLSEGEGRPLVHRLFPTALLVGGRGRRGMGQARRRRTLGRGGLRHRPAGRAAALHPRPRRAARRGPRRRPPRERVPVRRRRPAGRGGAGGGRAALGHPGGGGDRERGGGALLGLVRRAGRRAGFEGIARPPRGGARPAPRAGAPPPPGPLARRPGAAPPHHPPPPPSQSPPH